MFVISLKAGYVYIFTSVFFMGPRYINHSWASYFSTRYATTEPGESINFQNLPRKEDGGGDIILEGGRGVPVSVIAYKLQPVELKCECLTQRTVPWGVGVGGGGGVRVGGWGVWL